MDPLFSEILATVYILVGIALIFVLARSFQILSKILESAAIVNSRIREIDSLIEKTLMFAKGFGHTFALLKNMLKSIDE